MINNTLFRILLCLSVICAVGLFCGCTRSFIDDSAAADISQRGSVILEDYVKGLGIDDYKINRMTMMTGAEEGSIIWGGYYLSNVVECDFTAGEERYSAVVNLEDGSILSNYSMFDVNDAIEKQLVPYCERYGYCGEYSVSGAALYVRIVSHDMETTKKNGETVNTYVDLTDMIPAEYDSLSEEERIEKVMTGAGIEGFEIYYEIQNGEYLDPRVLTDYLAETGNHEMSGEGRFETWDYYLTGHSGGNEQNNLPQYWNQTIGYDDDPRKMSFSITHTTTEKIDEFCFKYTDRYKSGKMEFFEDAPFSNYELPVEINGNVLSYYYPENGFDVSMYFTEKPKYTEFTRTVYDRGIAHDPEELVLEQKDGGTWSLNLKEDPFRKDLWYFFDKEQDIVFK